MNPLPPDSTKTFPFTWNQYGTMGHPGSQ